MSSDSFRLQFASSKQSFDIEFQEQIASPSTVTVSGRDYSMSGVAIKIEWIKEKIPELKSHADIPLQTLKERFSSLENEDVKESSVVETHSVVFDRLGIKEEQKIGDVIAIVGPSSVGKSTIINAVLVEQPDRIEEGTDISGLNVLNEFISSNHERLGVSKLDFQHLHSVLVPKKNNRHILDAIFEEKYTWKSEVTSEDKERATKIIFLLRDAVIEFDSTLDNNDLILMDRIFNYSMKNQNTVFDIINIDPIEERLKSLGKKTTVKYVLAYCPFHTLTERMAERNRKALETGDTHEIRAGTIPLAQYAKLFGPKQESDREEDVIDIVTKKLVEEDFDTNWEAGLEHFAKCNPEEFKKASSNGSMEKERIEGKKALLTALGFDELDPSHKSVKLVPRKKYDLCINTSDSSLGTTAVERGRAAAKKILSYKTL